VSGPKSQSYSMLFVRNDTKSQMNMEANSSSLVFLLVRNRPWGIQIGHSCSRYCGFIGEGTMEEFRGKTSLSSREQNRSSTTWRNTPLTQTRDETTAATKNLVPLGSMCFHKPWIWMSDFDNGACLLVRVKSSRLGLVESKPSGDQSNRIIF